jgi:GAF domain-containing protein
MAAVSAYRRGAWMTASPAPDSPSGTTPELALALEVLVRVVERQSREFRASILMLSDDGTRLLDGAAPSLPAAYRRAIDGLGIGPATGSCGTAAHRNERVIVTDIESDPLWEAFRDIARPHGLAACWSEPIRTSDGELVGTFAMYYGEPREPTAVELELIAAAAERAGRIIEQARAGADGVLLVADLE